MHEKSQIKIIFTGSVGAGKTTAIATISETLPISTDVISTEASVKLRKSKTTVAMDYGELTLNNGEKVHLYGTPGQIRFAFMTEILTAGALGLIILIDNSDDDPLAQLDYYLHLNEEFLMDNPAVVGITHFDEASRPAIKDYYSVLENRGYLWPVVRVDAREAADIHLLLETLLALLEYN
jgi:hypothetical protein